MNNLETDTPEWPFPTIPRGESPFPGTGPSVEISIDPSLVATRLDVPVNPRKKRAARTAEVVDPPAVNSSLPVATEVIQFGKVTHTDMTPLKYEIGIELTMIPTVIIGKGSSYDSGIVSHFASIVERLVDREKLKLHYSDPSRDQFAVEVPSAPFKTWGKVKEFYDKYTDLMRKVGLEPHHPKVNSGGGHIHVGPLKVPTTINIIRDVQNKPWLMWTFNDPDDAITSNSFTDNIEVMSDDLRKAAASINANPSLFSDSISDEGSAALMFFGNPQFVDAGWLSTSKNRSIRYAEDTETTEFRFFDAPVDWHEQEAHIRFVQAYVAYIEKTYKTTWVDVKVTKKSDLAKMTVEQCEKDFRDFLTVLGLPHAPYERMITENLHERFRRGKRV